MSGELVVCWRRGTHMLEHSRTFEKSYVDREDFHMLKVGGVFHVLGECDVVEFIGYSSRQT